MQITVVGDDLYASGVRVAGLDAARSVEREDLRDLIRHGLDCSLDMKQEIEDLERDAASALDRAEEAESDLQSANDEIAELRGAVEDAIELFKNNYPGEALKILAKALA